MLTARADRIDQIKPPPFDRFQKHWNVFWKILQIGVHRDNYVARRVAKSSFKSAGLSRALRVFDWFQMGMSCSQLLQQFKTAVAGMIVASHMLPIASRLQRGPSRHRFK